MNSTLNEEDFLVVYEIPEDKMLTDGFCFSGGKSITFKNVDWMNGPPDGLSEDEFWYFLKAKAYLKLGKKYLLICPAKNFSKIYSKDSQ